MMWTKPHRKEGSLQEDVRALLRACAPGGPALSDRLTLASMTDPLGQQLREALLDVARDARAQARAINEQIKPAREAIEAIQHLLLERSQQWRTWRNPVGWPDVPLNPPAWPSLQKPVADAVIEAIQEVRKQIQHHQTLHASRQSQDATMDEIAKRLLDAAEEANVLAIQASLEATRTTPGGRGEGQGLIGAALSALAGRVEGLQAELADLMSERQRTAHEISEISSLVRHAIERADLAITQVASAQAHDHAALASIQSEWTDWLRAWRGWTTGMDAARDRQSIIAGEMQGMVPDLESILEKTQALAGIILNLNEALGVES